VRGQVISLHALGATVRLEDGQLVAVPAGDVQAHRDTYARACERRRPISFELVDMPDRRPQVVLAARHPDEPIEPAAAPVTLVDDAFEEKMATYLRATEEWAPADRPPPAERHFLRKRRRAATVSTGMPRNRGAASRRGES
jgi:hypothetical protein